MKKMVCEICGSQSLRKENGLFVCQQCGAEYSVEDAKQLLREICDNKEAIVKSTSVDKKTNVSGKECLIQLLYAWALNLSKMPDPYVWFNSNMSDDEFWKNTILEISTHKLKPYFPRIDNSNNNFFDTHLDISRRFYNTDGPLKDVIKKEVPKSAHYKINSFFKKIYSFKISGMEVSLSEYCERGYYGFESDQPTISLFKLYSRKDVDFQLYNYKPTIFLTYKKYNAPSEDQEMFIKLLKTSADTVNEFRKKHNELMDYYEEHYYEICELAKEINEKCTQLENELYLPYKYRNIETILNLIDILVDGKADNWMDLINLYDTQQYRKGVYDRLEIINNKLDKIQNVLISGFSTIITQLNNIQNGLANIDSTLCSIESDVNRIKHYSFISMWELL